MNNDDKNTPERAQRDQSASTPLKPFDVPFEDLQRELKGARPVEDQSAIIDASDVEGLGELTQSDIYEGELEAGVDDDLPTDEVRLELLTELELRADETDDAHEAAEEGFTYIPPIDPPTRVSVNMQDAEIASGFGVSALDEPYDADHPSSFLPGDDDLTARVRDALRADSISSGYADRIGITTSGSTVILRGVVDDLEDSDNLVAVAAYVEGIDEVIDELEVRTLQQLDEQSREQGAE